MHLLYRSILTTRTDGLYSLTHSHTHTHTHTVTGASLSPPRPPFLPIGTYLIYDSKIILREPLSLPDLGVTSGITSNWVITDLYSNGTEVPRDVSDVIVHSFSIN